MLTVPNPLEIYGARDSLDHAPKHHTLTQSFRVQTRQCLGYTHSTLLAKHQSLATLSLRARGLALLRP